MTAAARSALPRSVPHEPVARRAVVRGVQWGGPYLAIWIVAGRYVWWLFGGPSGCEGLCVAAHVWFAYLAVAIGLGLSALVGLVQAALLIFRPRARSRALG